MLELYDVCVVNALQQLRLFSQQIYLIAFHKLFLDNFQRNKLTSQLVLGLIHSAEGTLAQYSLEVVIFSVGLAPLQRLQLGQVFPCDLPLGSHYL